MIELVTTKKMSSEIVEFSINVNGTLSFVLLQHVSIKTGSVLKHFLTQHAFYTGSYYVSLNMSLAFAFLTPVLATVQALPHHLVVPIHLPHHLLQYQDGQVYK